jgi:hypothetical protein
MVATVAENRITPRLQKAYREQVLPKVLKEFNLANVNEAPRIAAWGRWN